MIYVSWEAAKAYVAWLSKETGQQPYRLLSEAEWEYACRAGSTTRYSWGDDPPIPERANFGRNVRKTSEVGAYPANPWSLYDVHGNVWEWVEDCYAGGCEPPRVLRGGSWSDGPGLLRSASYDGGYPDIRSKYIGFRVARTLR